MILKATTENRPLNQRRQRFFTARIFAIWLFSLTVVNFCSNLAEEIQLEFYIRQVEVQPDTAELFEEYTVEDGFYQNHYMTMIFPTQFLKLEEQFSSLDNPIVVSVSNVEEPPGAIPRIDNLSVALYTFTNGTAVALEEESQHNLLENYLKMFIGTYYGVEADTTYLNNIDLGFPVSFTNTKTNLTETTVLCSTTASVGAQGNLPAMTIECKIEGEGEYGVVTLMVYHNTINEISLDILTAVYDSIDVF